jgi:YD repeat-containing protein
LAVTVNSAPRASFVYDGLGRCVKRTLNGVTRLFNYDGWQPIYEWDGAGQFVAWNLYGVQRGSVCESRQNALDTIGRRGEDRRRPCPGKLASNSKALSIISSTEAIIASRFFAMIRIENGS